jgi:hypothetical protein
VERVSFFVSINGALSFDLPLNGDTFRTSASGVISMQLQAGINTIDLVRAITDLTWIESQSLYEKCKDYLGIRFRRWGHPRRPGAP